MNTQRGTGYNPRATSATPIAAHQLTPPWRHNPHEPLTAEDHADVALLATATQRGFRLATRLGPKLLKIRRCEPDNFLGGAA